MAYPNEGFKMPMLQEAKSNWQAVKKGINLVPEENDDIK